MRIYRYAYMYIHVFKLHLCNFAALNIALCSCVGFHVGLP